MKRLLLFLIFLSITQFVLCQDQNNYKTSDFQKLTEEEKLIFSKGVAAGIESSVDVFKFVAKGIEEDESVPIKHELYETSKLFYYIAIIDEDQKLTSSVLFSLMDSADKYRFDDISTLVHDILINLARNKPTKDKIEQSKEWNW